MYNVSRNFAVDTIFSIFNFLIFIFLYNSAFILHFFFVKLFLFFADIFKSISFKFSTKLLFIYGLCWL